MFVSRLELRLGDRVFDLVAHPFYSLETGELKYRPQVYEILETETIRIISLPSTFSDEEAIQIALDYAKGFVKNGTIRV